MFLRPASPPRRKANTGKQASTRKYSKRRTGSKNEENPIVDKEEAGAARATKRRRRGMPLQVPPAAEEDAEETDTKQLTRSSLNVKEDVEQDSEIAELVGSHRRRQSRKNKGGRHNDNDALDDTVSGRKEEEMKVNFEELF